MLVPIVIGVLAAVTGFTAIIFFHLKRRITSRKYDAECTNVTTDMTGNHSERLNETTRYKNSTRQHARWNFPKTMAGGSAVQGPVKLESYVIVHDV